MSKKKCTFENCDGQNNIDPQFKTHTTIDTCPNKKCKFPGCDGKGNIKRGNYHNDMNSCPLNDLAEKKARELDSLSVIFFKIQYFIFQIPIF